MKNRTSLIILASLTLALAGCSTSTPKVASSRPPDVTIATPPQYKVYTDSQREPKGSITTWSAKNSEASVVFNFHNETSGSNWLVNLRLADGYEIQANKPDEREPKGSHNHYWDSVGTNGAYNPNIYVYLHNSISGSNWIASISAYKTITLPYILRDVDTGVTFEVEADGRHVSATDIYGALLWYRDPFADAHMEYYRTDKPKIVDFYICKRKPSEDWTIVEQVLGKKGVSVWIAIRYNSSQAGFMDPATGDFYFTGQL